MDFTTNAITWDNERRVERARIISNEIIKRIDIENIDKALDFGCGTGLISFNLCQYLQQIVLVDVFIARRKILMVIMDLIKKNYQRHYWSLD